MDELVISLLDNYDLEMNKSGRCRGAVLVYCKEGIYTIREYLGSSKHLEFEEIVLDELSEQHGFYVDQIVRTKEGELLTEDIYGKKYIVRRFYPGRDFDIKNHGDILRGSELIARLHNQFNQLISAKEMASMYFYQSDICESLCEEFYRRSRELKRTRNYIRDKNNKNEFERMVMNSYDVFCEDALYAESLMDSDMKQYIEGSVNEVCMIHGNYNYHNILFAGDGEWEFITNFDRTRIGIQVKDLYDYLRKTMEKYKWDERLGMKIVREYSRIKMLTDGDMKYLKMKLIYPEKYWKILNHYNNHNKYWLPDKDIDKLKKTIAERERRISFVKQLES